MLQRSPWPWITSTSIPAGWCKHGCPGSRKCICSTELATARTRTRRSGSGERESPSHKFLASTVVGRASQVLSFFAAATFKQVLQTAAPREAGGCHGIADKTYAKLDRSCRESTDSDSKRVAWRHGEFKRCSTPPVSPK